MGSHGEARNGVCSHGSYTVAFADFLVQCGCVFLREWTRILDGNPPADSLYYWKHAFWYVPHTVLIGCCFFVSCIGYIAGEYVKVVVDMCERKLSFYAARPYDYANVDRRKVEPVFKLLTQAQIPESNFPEIMLFASFAPAYASQYC